MTLSFEPMTAECAAKIASWRYPPPYAVYGYADEDAAPTVRYLTLSENQFYAVRRAGELVAFRSFGPDGRVAGGDYDEAYLDTGGGLRPDLTGRGYGAETIEAGLAFGRSTFGERRFRVTVADFTQRAQKVCRGIGFKPTHRFDRTPDGAPFTIFTIELGDV